MPLITSRLSPVHRVRFAQFGPVVAVCVCASYTYKALYCRGLYTRKIAGRQQFLIIPKTKDEDLEDILYIDDSGNTSHNLAANLGLGIYFKLHPSAWVDIAAGYRKVFDSRGNESLGGTYRYPYGRIGIVYPLGYR